MSSHIKMFQNVKDETTNIKIKLEKLEKDIFYIKEMLVEIQCYIIKVDKKVPQRTVGWFGEYKTYELE
jgi:archaellum component FlaC